MVGQREPARSARLENLHLVAAAILAGSATIWILATGWEENLRTAELVVELRQTVFEQALLLDGFTEVVRRGAETSSAAGSLAGEEDSGRSVVLYVANSDCPHTEVNLPAINRLRGSGATVAVHLPGEAQASMDALIRTTGFDGKVWRANEHPVLALLPVRHLPVTVHLRQGAAPSFFIGGLTESDEARLAALVGLPGTSLDAP